VDDDSYVMGRMVAPTPETGGPTWVDPSEIQVRTPSVTDILVPTRDHVWLGE
jgi:hypothetical protein